MNYQTRFILITIKEELALYLASLSDEELEAFLASLPEDQLDRVMAILAPVDDERLSE